MGHIKDTEDGPGYTAPVDQALLAAQDRSYAQLAASTDIEFRDPMIGRAEAVPSWRPEREAEHPAAADLERLSNFLSECFPGDISGRTAVDAAIEILRGLLITKSVDPGMADPHWDSVYQDNRGQVPRRTVAPHNAVADARWIAASYPDFEQMMKPDPRTVQPGEVRSVDPRTGAEKGVKLARFGLIPQGPLHELAEHFGVGAGKYADNQWRAGYDWSKSYDALCRHLSAFWSGEDIDPDPAMKGASHLAAAAWHVFALMEFTRTFPQGDDRWKES